LGGFNNSSIARLRFTKAQLPSKSAETLTKLEALMSVDSSSKNYREALHSSNPPCIPYLGTYLSDLTFIDEGNPDTVNGLINFGKKTLTYRVVSEVQRYQLQGYNLKKFGLVAKFTGDVPTRDEKTYNQKLYELSMTREPRGAEKVP